MNPSNSKLRILLVEDDPGEAGLISRALVRARADHELTVCPSLSRALTALTSEVFDTVLLDLSLPDSFGIATVEQIVEVAPRTSIVVMTGNDDEELALEAVRAGAQEYIVKGSVEPSMFWKLLRSAVEKQRIQADLERARQGLEERVRERTAQLADSEANFRLLLESIQDYAILRISPFGILTTWNMGAQRIFGWKPSQILGHHMSDLWASSDAQTFIERTLSTVLETGRVALDTTLKRSNNEHFPASVTFSTITIPGALPVTGYAVVVRDITELRSAHERALANERLAALGQMTTGLMHESRNALQRIQATVNRLYRRMRGNEEFEGLIREIEMAGDDLRHIFDQLRNYAAPMTLDRSLIPVKDLVLGTWEKLSIHDKHARIAIRLQPRSPRSTVFGDWFRLEQVLRNVLENALDATPNENPQITIECLEQTIDNAQHVTICVRDNGKGFKPEDRDRAFSAFFTTKNTGTGLGLAVCRRIIEAHRGTIELGEPDHGAEIRITLPANERSLEDGSNTDSHS